MTEEFHQNIGKMLSNMEYNTKLTEGIVQKLSGMESDTKAMGKQINAIEVHLATLNSKVASHQQYIGNLDERIVEERKHRESIKEEIALTKGGTKIVASLWGIISAIIVGVVTFILTKE